MIDCFPYFNERELLELRINLLKDHVSKFIICDADHTHSGASKPFTCRETIKELGLPEDKILVVEVNLPSKEQEPDNWVRERMQRNAAAAYIPKDAVCFVGDCDEIIDPAELKYYTLTAIKNPNNILRVPLVNLNGRADLRVHDASGQPRNWLIPFLCRYHHLSKYTLSEIRESNSMLRNDIEYSDVYITQDGNIKTAGWHFSWMGNASRLKTKCKSFMHVTDWVTGAIAQPDSTEIDGFLDTYVPTTGTTDPLGRPDHILQDYPVELLPQQLFDLERVRNFLLPN